MRCNFIKFGIILSLISGFQPCLSQNLEKTLDQDLWVSKTDNKETAEPDLLILYTITCGNRGSTDALDIVVIDVIPCYTEYDKDNTSPEPENTEIMGDDGRMVITWHISEIPANSSYEEPIILAVKIFDQIRLPIGTTTLVNNVTIHNNLEWDMGSDETKIIAMPDLYIEKSDGVPSAQPGDSLTYSIIFQNKGNYDAQQIVIMDTIPEDFTTFISATPPRYTLTDNQIIEWQLNTIPAHSPIDTFQVTIKISSLMPLGTTRLTNIASISTRNDERDSTNNRDEDNTDVNAKRDLEITKKDDNRESARPGDLLMYEIEFRNTGNMTADSVVLKDDLPLYTYFHSCSSGGVYDPDNNSVLWYIGTVPPNSGITKKWVKVVVYNASILPEEVSLTNKVIISSKSDEDNKNNNKKTDNTIIRGDPFQISVEARSKDGNDIYRNTDVLFEITSSKPVDPSDWNLKAISPDGVSHAVDISGFSLQPDIPFIKSFKPDEVGEWKVSVSATNIFGEEADAEDDFMVKGPCYIKPMGNIFYPEKDHEIVIAYGIGAPGQASIRVYTIAGDLVRNLFDEYTNEVEGYRFWDGRNDKNEPVASGVFIITLESELKSDWKKIIVIR